MTYRETAPPADLAPVVACVWNRGDGEVTVLPDGCLDLMWFGDAELLVAGADTAARAVALPAGTRTTGIRLRAEAAGAVLGVPATELRDRVVDAEMLWGSKASAIAERLRAVSGAAVGATGATGALVDVLAAAVRHRRAAPDPLVAAAAAELARPGARIGPVAADLGVTERTLHRRTLAAVGYGPKTLARVARLENLRRATGPLAERALDAGYASQSHMNDEVRRLTGTTPVRFLEDRGNTPA